MVDPTDLNTLKAIVDRFTSAMLITRDESGELHARPMHVAQRHDDVQLVFATSIDSGKVDEIQEDHHAAVTMQDDGHYVSLSGMARISNDRSRVENLWSDAWRVWFPDGPEDAYLRLIDFDPISAVYWDVSGAQRLEFLVEAGKAILRGEPLDTEQLSAHAKLDLSDKV